jgi:hypothetical protein
MSPRGPSAELEPATKDYQTMGPSDSHYFAIRLGTKELSCQTLSSEPDDSG